MTDTARRCRGALTAAVTFMVGLPLAAFLLAPAAMAQVREATSNAGPPGSQLAGINTSATAAAIQISPLTPGIVGAGDVAKGNLVEASLPYASSTVSTGPSTGGVASPAYPGPTAAAAGTAIQTFAPTFPAPLVNLLNDPVLARSAYPPQVHTGSSGSYAPPGAGLLGIGTASTDSGPSATTSTSSLSDTASLGSVLAGAPLVAVASARSSSNASVGAASVTTGARTALGAITIGGVVKIAGISSEASASSNGTAGQETNSLHIGAVTVAGVSASVGPNGITLNNTGLLGQLGLVPLANQALTALQQAGLTIKTIAPTSQQNGQSASVTSGALQISFVDPNIPNPQGRLPIGSSVGLDFELGLSNANADATVLPAFTPLPSVVAPPPVPASSGGSPAVAGQPATAIPGAPISSGSSALGPSFGSAQSTAAGGGALVPSASSPSSGPVATLAGFVGIPVRVAWVILAFVLSLVAAGPLLAYANWQLLRGRTS